MERIVIINMVRDFLKKVMKFSIAKNVISSKGKDGVNMVKDAIIFMVVENHTKVIKFNLDKNVISSKGMDGAVAVKDANIFMVVEILDQRMEPITKRSREGTRGEGGKQ